MQLQGTRVLVVDDEALIRGMLISDLKRLGCNVLEASCGDEARAILAKEPVDLVISDVMMPHGDGTGLLEHIRSTKGIKLPVAFMSGFADIPFWDAYARGVEAYFGKPFDVELIPDLLRSLKKPLEERWYGPPVATTERLELTFSANTSRTGGYRVGRGGVFVTVKQERLRRGQYIAFKLTDESSPIPVLEGTGIIRWSRFADEQNLPDGCGIEFLSLTAESRDRLLAYLRANPPIAFIPRSLE